VRFEEFEATHTALQQMKRSAPVKDLSPRASSGEEQSSAPLTPESLKSRQREKARAPETPAPQAVAMDASIFRAYDIRGAAGGALTPAVVYELGRAIGSEAHKRGEQKIAVARDARPSSAELSEALTKGLKDSGRDVIDLGLAPTPLLYFSSQVLATHSGVMVTGGRQGPGINGLKAFLMGEMLTREDIQEFKRRVLERDYAQGSGRVDRRDVAPEYMGRIIDNAQIGQSLKVVVDCANGAAAALVPQLLKALDCTVVELHCDLGGDAPLHAPDPSRAENLKELADAVLVEKADLGLAFDSDGDRLGVVDSQGRIVWPDRLLMLFAAEVLSCEPGTDVVFDAQCSRHLPTHIVRHGGRPLMWKSGHGPIKAKMQETGALLGGDMNGYMLFKDRWLGFGDGIYAAARLVEILSGDPRGSAEVFSELPVGIGTPELSIALPEGENAAFVDRLKSFALFPDARLSDVEGLRLDFADGWGLVRASTTTPNLRIRFEADSEEALRRIQEIFRNLLTEAKPDLQVSF
jgi:phosphomannomutase/phosphoglucomutase